MIDSKLLKSEERAVINLRALYKSYGYRPFKMSKFEEYDLYATNKDFLVSDRVITFNDTDGKLLALKPDVTLSIIKNTKDSENEKNKVYYNENVYRISKSTGQFKEIMQTGLECIGNLDISDTFEVISLAAKSLAVISHDYVLDISHMGILSAIFDAASCDERFRRAATVLVAEKNAHEIRSLCEIHSQPDAVCEALVGLSTMYGDMTSVLARLKPLAVSNEAQRAYEELSMLAGLLNDTYFSSHIRFDFSVVNNMNYYSGIVFRGFISGIFEGVLAGGEYGKLVVNMGKAGRAVGFALYLDLLSVLEAEKSEYDVDMLLLYDDSTLMQMLVKKEELISSGKTVYSARKKPDNIRYRDLIVLGGEGNA